MSRLVNAGVRRYRAIRSDSSWTTSSGNTATPTTVRSSSSNGGVGELEEVLVLELLVGVHADPHDVADVEVLEVVGELADHDLVDPVGVGHADRR